MLLAGCQSNPITNAQACVEIPFLDGPEGACVWTVTHETELINAENWKKERPYMIMIPASSWSAIKRDWLKACRMAGPDCNLAVDSIDDVIRKLDVIVGEVMKRTQ